MSNRLDSIKVQFDLHTRLYNNVLRDISNQDADNRLSEAVNHMKWLAGHLMATRMGMYKIGGFEKDTSWDEFFAHGKSIDSSLNYPALSGIIDRFNSISDKISAGLTHLPETVLESESSIKFPVSDQTMLGSLSFLMHHEAYHLGQIGLLRKYVGKEAMKYN